MPILIKDTAPREPSGLQDSLQARQNDLLCLFLCNLNLHGIMCVYGRLSMTEDMKHGSSGED